MPVIGRGDQDEEITVTTVNMYRVQGTMRENYYGSETEEMPRKSNLVSIEKYCVSTYISRLYYIAMHAMPV